MSELAERVAGLSPAQRKLLEQRLKRQPAAAGPIAIIGMGCRFPGARDVPSYWQLIREGRSAVREVPPERWNIDAFYDPSGETAGKMSVRWAAFIDDPDKFDPQFFGITPREAARIDPQQRLLLEVAWETMENAGRPADELAGTRTAVFVGIGGNDYSKVPLSYDDYYQHIDAHMGTGNALSIAANRLSYIFDFHGPSAAVDTACSSSSLAIHLAVDSLRRGESDAALAGGVNLILTPETTIAFSKARMLSPDGVCRPFDSQANGYVRGEGCGLVLLKRLADAERDGDQILGILRGTSVNQDGRTSGISAPNSQMQAACIRAAQQQAGVKPEDISYIEAHGTGTPLGDPIEMTALAEIFRSSVDVHGIDDGGKAPSPCPLPEGEGSVRPCYVTSVKANVGHMETVSGVAGLIKVALMLQHDEIVPQAHFAELNPHIKLEDTRLVIPREPTAWPREERSRIAGISSFGFGGTNTHLIVESPIENATRTTSAEADAPSMSSTERPIHLLKLSAKNEAALAEGAAHLADYLEHEPGAKIADVCWSANTGRADFNHRAVVSAADNDQLRQRLQSMAAGGAAVAGVKQAVVRTLGRPNVAFLFTGQGSQYVGMGRGLYESQPVFRGALEECDAILREIWDGESLLNVMYPVAESGSSAERLHQTRYTQPALFALEYSLAELWASWGVTPDIVLGHSVGEFAAACVAGVMSLEDSLALIAERARLMQNVQRRGKMAVVFAAQDRVARQIAATNGAVVVAVINGPENTVISGDAAAVDATAAKFQAEGVQVKMLNVSHAFHSPLMDEMLEEFEEFAAGIEYEVPQVPLAANLTGQLMKTAPTARYWRDHLRNSVQFAAGMARIAEASPTTIIEIGPTASLLGMGRRCALELEAAWLPSLREGQDDWQVITASVGEHYVRGGRVDWRGWDRPWRRSRVWLPNYPFQRARHWFTLEPSRWRGYAGAGAPAVGVVSEEKAVHPLLGTPLSTVWANSLFEARLSARSPAYLVDHQVQGSAVTPAAAYVEQGLAAAEKVFGAGKHGLANLVIQQAMFLPEEVSRRVQIAVTPESGGEATFETHSRPAAEAGGPATAWTMHATGQLVHESKSAADVADGVDLAAAWDRACKTVLKDDFYASMAERGLTYGPAFRVLVEMGRGTQDAVARIELPESVRREAAQYHLHPALGDALLQAMAGAVPLEEDGSFSPFTYMPVGIRRVRVAAAIDDVDRPLFAYTLRTSLESGPSPEQVEANVFLTDGDGHVLVALEGVQVQRVGRGSGGESSTDTSRWVYEIAWQEKPLAIEAPTTGGQTSIQPNAGAWLVFADSGGVGRQLAEWLAKNGASSVLVERASEFRFADHGGNGQAPHHAIAAIDPLDESHYSQLIDAAFGRTGRGCLGVVHLWSLDILEPSLATASPERPSPSLKGRGIDEARALGCGSALQLVRALARASFAKQPALWLVTAGAQAVSVNGLAESAPISVQQAPMLGFGRVAAIELPDLRARLVDLDAAVVLRQGSEAASALSDELSAPSDEGQVAYRQGRRFVARLQRNPSLVADEARSNGAALTVPSGQFQLHITQPGSFDALRFVAVGQQPPEPGQVEIEVRATGLNFSDVLKALGLYPGIKDAIVPLGIEASGVVTAVGEGARRFSVGDEVFGVVPYAFASHARTAEYALVHKPKSIDHDAACTIPITFLTAYYGLVRLANLQPGERVLIHAGAGGVGLAAIQIAQQIGAEVFATAGSEAKRDFLRSLGVSHVYSSRSTAFADEILADTDREGVDVVLNSLPGEAITKSLAILRAYGRFLEIGKTDIYQNRMIGLLPFQDNLSYHAIDLDRLLRQRPDYVRELFADVMRHFEAGQYEPLMFTRFEAGGTIDAFRYMSQRKNIGKVVVSIADCGLRIADNQSEIRNPKSEIGVVQKNGTYLISGGSGALGLRVAEWLAEQGAGTVALLSRRGATAEVEPALERIRKKGASVIVLRGDVTDASSLAGALEEVRATGLPVRGVIHAAGVLADGILTDMSLDQLDRAMSPKVQGAWNLHAATLEAPLDFFVMFSSVASVLGSPGQANYAAGNAYLDALAHARRAQGLPATAINWGPWAGSGMAVEAGRGEGIKSRGMSLIDPELGLEMLAKLMRSDAAQVAVMDAEWPDLLRLMGSRRPALLHEIATEIEQAGGESTGSRVDHAFRQQLLAADGDTRQSLVADYIRMELARIMGIEPASLESDQPLSTFGLDSLLALELKNNLEGRLDFTLPMAKLMEGPSIASLAEETARLLVAGESDGGRGGDGTSASEAAEEWTPLLALRSGGERPPLVMLPPLGGDVQCYAEVVQALGADQPVYAFRPRGVDQDLPPHLTMDETIADYLAALRKLQPNGPYYLAAWSTGGIFAYALAEALERSGEKVDLLALFDTPLPSICDEVDVEDDTQFFCKILNFANLSSGKTIRFSYEEMSRITPDEQFTTALVEARRCGMIPMETPEAYVRRLVHVGEANVRVIQSYKAHPLFVPIQLFVPTTKGALKELSGREPMADQDHGWSREVGQIVNVQEVSGDHFSMMSGPGAAFLARELMTRILGKPTSRQREPQSAKG